MLSKEDNNIHNRLFDLIESKNLNVNSFANLLGVSPTVIHNIVKGRPDGKKSKPSFSLLKKILLSIDDLDSHWLITGEQKSETENSLEFPITDVEKEELYQSLLIQKLEAQIQDLQADKEELYNLLQNAIKKG